MIMYNSISFLLFVIAVAVAAAANDNDNCINNQECGTEGDVCTGKSGVCCGNEIQLPSCECVQGVWDCFMAIECDRVCQTSNECVAGDCVKGFCCNANTEEMAPPRSEMVRPMHNSIHNSRIAEITKNLEYLKEKDEELNNLLPSSVSDGSDYVRSEDIENEESVLTGIENLLAEKESNGGTITTRDKETLNEMFNILDGMMVRSSSDDNCGSNKECKTEGETCSVVDKEECCGSSHSKAECTCEDGIYKCLDTNACWNEACEHDTDCQNGEKCFQSECCDASKLTEKTNTAEEENNNDSEEAAIVKDVEEEVTAAAAIVDEEKDWKPEIEYDEVTNERDATWY